MCCWWVAYAEALNEFDMNSNVVLRRPKDGNLYCATDGTCKLIWRLDHPKDGVLYNMVDDPDEAQDLFSPGHAQLQRLRSILESMEPFRSQPFPPAGLPEDASALGALESLDYVGGSATSAPAADEQP